MRTLDSKKKLMVASRPKAMTLHKLLNEHSKPLEISPVHVLVISLLFIANVFLLHMYARFGPSSSIYQLFFAAVILGASVMFGISMNKR